MPSAILVRSGSESLHKALGWGSDMPSWTRFRKCTAIQNCTPVGTAPSSDETIRSVQMWRLHKVLSFSLGQTLFHLPFWKFIDSSIKLYSNFSWKARKGGRLFPIPKGRGFCCYRLWWYFCITPEVFYQKKSIHAMYIF